MFKFALAFALVLVAVAAEDQCLDHSLAVFSVGQVGTINNLATLASEADTEAEIISILQSIKSVVDTTYSRSYENVYVATSNNNYYGYFSCHYYPASTCTNVEDKIFLVRNDAVYGGGNAGIRRAFFNNPAGGAQGLYGSVYPTTDRPWYNAAEDSSNKFWISYVFSDGVHYGRTYVDATKKGNVGFVIAGDRRANEPCEYCIQRLEAASVAEVVAAGSGFRTFANSAGSTRRQNAASYLLAALENSLYDVQSVYFGLDTKEFHMVIDCKRTNKDVAPACGFNNERYVYGVRDGELTTRLFFNIDKAGDVDFSNEIFESGDYDPTVRPWFVYEEGGWSDEYTYANTIYVGRTYAAPFDGGMVGADPTVKAILNSCNGAGVLAASLVAVVLAALAM